MLGYDGISVTTSRENLPVLGDSLLAKQIFIPFTVNKAQALTAQLVVRRDAVIHRLK